MSKCPRCGSVVPDREPNYGDVCADCEAIEQMVERLHEKVSQRYERGPTVKEACDGCGRVTALMDNDGELLCERCYLRAKLRELEGG